ncbi:MAG: hypothetical protein IKR34_02705 [Candidatus Gastranaerophilales bacterium]|nr:hypothetical protein [Candidatus Gastranaerophilales bacterium]
MTVHIKMTKINNSELEKLVIDLSDFCSALDLTLKEMKKSLGDENKMKILLLNLNDIFYDMSIVYDDVIKNGINIYFDI